MNYTELCTAVESAAENDFSADDLARFCRNTEQLVYQVVQPPVLLQSSSTAMVQGTATYTLPASFLYPLSFAIIASGAHVYLLNKDVDFIREAYPAAATQGQPKVYALLDDTTALIGPTPDSNYAVELHYASYPESIVTASTSWLGDNFDTVLFNGMMVEACRFMKEEGDVLAMYKERFDQAMTLLKQYADGRLQQDTYRAGQPRVPVK